MAQERTKSAKETETGRQERRRGVRKRLWLSWKPTQDGASTQRECAEFNAREGQRDGDWKGTHGIQQCGGYLVLQQGNSVEGGGRGQESLDGEVSDWRSVCVESALKRLCCERD